MTVSTAARLCRLCLHCGTPLAARETRLYCCEGCESARELIEQLGLGDYYELPSRLTPRPDAAPRLGAAESDQALDEAAFVGEFTAASPAAAGRRVARLHLDGVRCYSCVWLCERAARHVAPAAEVSVNLASSIAVIDYDPAATSLGALAGALRRLGYRTTPLRPDEGAPLHDELLRLGTALFASLNVMSFAAAEYLAGGEGVGAELETLFRWASLALATLTLAYPAWPMVRASAAALRRRRIVIDLPILAAIVGAYLASVVSLVRGAGPVFFDSVTAVVSLLLVGRFVQKRALLRAERAIAGAGDAAAELVWRVEAGQPRAAALSAVKNGDLLRIPPGSLVPVAARVVEGEGEVSLEPLTGEAEPVGVTEGTRLRGGALNRGRPLLVRACEDGLSCYTERARRMARRMMAEKGDYTLWSDRLSGIFFAGTILVATATFMTWIGASPETAFARTVAVLLVACPCVFAYGAPLAFATCGSRGLARGVVFRSQRAIERLARARTVAFDKTGTLTEGTPRVAAVRTEAKDPAEEVQALRFLAVVDRWSAHHAARAAAEWARARLAGLPAPARSELGAIEESFGEGLTAQWQGRAWRLGRASFCAVGGDRGGWQGDLFLAVDGRIVMAFDLQDRVRDDSRAVVDWLRQRRYELAILSGDNERESLSVGRQLGLEAAAIESSRTPSAKALSVRGRGREVVMVGNGFNDAMAMAEAAVGVAVQGAGGAAHESAEVSLAAPGLMPLADAVELSRAAMRAVNRCFAFSASYNAAAIALAVAGYVSPLLAALLMPVNSLVVTLLATRWRMPAAALAAELREMPPDESSPSVKAS